MSNKIDITTIYHKVDRLISKIDFSALWKNFRRIKFALYTDNECCFNGKLIEKPDNFVGNTAVFYENEIIAIWNLQEELKDEVLASKIIHEMFHGFQMLHNDTRFPNEMEAIYSYEYKDENLSIKLKENNLIKELIGNFDLGKYNQFLKLRRYRSVQYSTQFLYESKVEQIEGTANYVELKALKKLSFALFKIKLNRMTNTIVESKNLIPIRIISYDIGALLIFLIKENGLNIDEQFSDRTFSECLIEDIELINPNIKLIMNSNINHYYETAKTIISNALSDSKIVETGTFKIISVNIYDAIFYEGYIISNNYVMYGSQEKPMIKYGDFVIKTEEKGILTKIYQLIE